MARSRFCWIRRRSFENGRGSLASGQFAKKNLSPNMRRLGLLLDVLLAVEFLSGAAPATCSESVPKMGRSNHGRSNLPTMAQAMPA